MWEGLTPEEIAVKCRKPLKKGWSLTGDAPDSIYDIMSRIREKGHELPVIINKEDEDVKYTDKQKHKAAQLFSQGMKPMKISEELGIPYKTVSKWTCAFKKQEALDIIASKKEEPAQAATCTDSESESLGKNSDPIITENTEIVKALPEALPTVVFDAILEKKDAVLKMIAAEEQLLKSLYADLAVLDEFICREVGSDE